MKQFFTSLIQALLKKHPLLTPMVVAIFLFGVGIGAVCARGMDESALGQAAGMLTNAEGGTFPNLLMQVFLHTLLPLLVLFLFSWSAIGAPVCLTIPAVKGFSIGFVLCFAVRYRQQKGVFFALLALFPRMVFEVPALLLLTVFSTGISVGLFHALYKTGEPGIRPGAYLFLFLILLFFELLLGLGFEYLQQLLIVQLLV